MPLQLTNAPTIIIDSEFVQVRSQLNARTLGHTFAALSTSPRMDDVLPLATYEGPFLGSSRRLALTMSLLWGVPMSLLAVMSTYHTLGLAYPLAISILGSLAFGFLFARAFRKKILALTLRLYEADPKLVPAPPVGAFTCRVLCNLALSPRMGVGGHLYAGPGQWVFVPHLKNLAKHRAPTVLSTEGAPQLTPQTESAGRLVRLFGPTFVTSLEVRDGGRVSKLYVPEPERVASTLRECGKRLPGSDSVA
jgi:hypothetical protein